MGSIRQTSVIPVKIVSEMTYNVSSGTLNLYTTTTTVIPPCNIVQFGR